MFNKKIKRIIAIALSTASLFALMGCYYQDEEVKHPTNSDVTNKMSNDNPYYYNKDGLEIKIHEFVECNTSCWLAVIKDSSETSRIGRSVSTLDFIGDPKAGKLDVSEMAQKKVAVLAINASSFKSDSNNSTINDNLAIHNGKIVNSSDYIYGNTLTINQSGHLDIPAYYTNLASRYYSSSSEAKNNFGNVSNYTIKTANGNTSNPEDQAITKTYLDKLQSKPSSMVTSGKLIGSNVTETIDFNTTPLVVNGLKTKLENSNYFGCDYNGFESNLHPRTVIAQTAKKGVNNSTYNEYVVLVTDGRQVPIFTNAQTGYNVETLPKSQGLNLQNLQDVLYNHVNEYSSKTILTAYNLDGGGSTQLYFNGHILNHPCEDSSGTAASDSDKSLRKVSDMIYFK